MDTNRYAPPKAELRDVVQGEAAPALWNPRAAAFWSFFLFTPAFGAFVQERNWRSLGEPERAFSSRVWGIAMLVLTLVLPCSVCSNPSQMPSGTPRRSAARYCFWSGTR
jgi:hypothetical protein